MKPTLFALATILALTASANAMSVMYRNDDLGFTVTAWPQTEDIEICDDGGSCLVFEPTGDGRTYQEAEGRCTLTMDAFEQDFAEGKTENDFMLVLMGQVVQVIEGEDQCQLQQAMPEQMRSLTGLYGF